jgi:hypothetical protein
MKVAFQGEQGAYSEIACYDFFGPEVDTLPLHSLEDTFQAVSDGSAEMGVVPIENTYAGTITKTYDLLMTHDLFIVGETHQGIVHCTVESEVPPEGVSTIVVEGVVSCRQPYLLWVLLCGFCCVGDYTKNLVSVYWERLRYGGRPAQSGQAFLLLEELRKYFYISSIGFRVGRPPGEIFQVLNRIDVSPAWQGMNQ